MVPQEILNGQQDKRRDIAGFYPVHTPKEEIRMKRTCKICGKDYDIEDDQIEYLVKVRMIHPFVSCKECSVAEVASLEKKKQDELIMKLGSPEGRNNLWKEIFEAHPEVRTAYVLNELEIE